MDNKIIRTKTGKRNRRELESMLLCAVLACMLSLSILLLFAVMLGQNIKSWNSTAAVGIYCVISGIIWGFLVIRNH